MRAVGGRPSRPSGRRGPRRLPFHRSRPPIEHDGLHRRVQLGRELDRRLAQPRPSGVSPGSAWSGRRRSLRQGRTGRSCASCEQLCVRLTAAIDRERLLDECPYNGIRSRARADRRGLSLAAGSDPDAHTSRPFASEGGESRLRTWTGPRDDELLLRLRLDDEDLDLARSREIVVTRASRSTKASD